MSPRDLGRKTCPVGPCTRLIPHPKFMCTGDWRRVPEALKRAVDAAYDDGAGVGTDALAVAQDAAIEAVEAKLAGRKP